MIGGIRFILASLVVLNHLWLPTANKLGAHAVTAFYVISGFLMAKVIHDVYGLSVDGGARFLGNKFLEFSRLICSFSLSRLCFCWPFLIPSGRPTPI